MVDIGLKKEKEKDLKEKTKEKLQKYQKIIENLTIKNINNSKGGPKLNTPPSDISDIETLHSDWMSSDDDET